MYQAKRHDWCLGRSPVAHITSTLRRLLFEHATSLYHVDLYGSADCSDVNFEAHFPWYPTMGRVKTGHLVHR